MAATIDVEVTGSAVGERYRVTWTVTSAVDMPAEVLLLKYADMTFQGVVRADELGWPTTRTNGQGFYRQSTAYADYGTIAEANTAKATVAADLQGLVDDYNSGLAAFLTTTSTTYS